MSFEESDEARLRVVFLDDDPAMRRALVRAGAASRLDVVAVESPEEARVQLTQGADLAVLDFCLGEGETTADLAYELHHAGSLVVIWTGNGRQAREAVGEDIPVIDKSANPHELFRTVVRLIRERAAELAAFALLWGGGAGCL